jgi:ABC-type transport system involved in multi-copper enzyme maturation permease subunit
MSPIHDQTYRHYGGGRAAPGHAWTVIAWAGIRNMIRKRAFLGLLLIASVQFIIRAIMIYAAVNYQQVATVLATTPDTFRSYLDSQGFWVFVIAIYAGAGLIANDRRANALQIYLSKPLLRVEYIFGKAAVLFAFLALVTTIPALLLLLVQIAFAGDLTFLKNNLFVVPAILVASLLQVLLASFTMLALSSLSKSARYVAVLYAGIILFTKAVFGVMYLATGSSMFAWISPTDSLAQVMDVLFRVKPRYDVPWTVSLLVVIALIALSISVLERRVRGVEVVT